MNLAESAASCKKADDAWAAGMPNMLLQQARFRSLVSLFWRLKPQIGTCSILNGPPAMLLVVRRRPRSTLQVEDCRREDKQVWYTALALMDYPYLCASAFAGQSSLNY